MLVASGAYRPLCAITSISSPQVLVCVVSLSTRATASLVSSLFVNGALVTAAARPAISFRFMAGTMLVAVAIDVAAVVAALEGTPVPGGGQLCKAPVRRAAMIALFRVL